MRINKKKSSQNNEILEKLSIIVSHSRRGEYSDAASEMNLFLQQFQKYIKSGFVPDKQLKNIAYSLETVLLLQENDDWVAVADILEFELSSYL